MKLIKAKLKTRILTLVVLVTSLSGASILQPPQMVQPQTDYEEYLIVEPYTEQKPQRNIVNDNKYNMGESGTNTQHKLAEENVGSSNSLNLNCGGQFISGVPDSQCSVAATDINGPSRAFTIIVVANEGEILCEPPLPPGDSFLASIAEGDGTVTGNYTITHIGTVTQQRTGDISTATTDGNRYSINAENLGFCSELPGEITISGECGDDVIIRYEDPSAVATFTGDVECMLSA